jgi:hypothetical protein
MGTLSYKVVAFPSRSSEYTPEFIVLSQQYWHDCFVYLASDVAQRQ